MYVYKYIYLDMYIISTQSRTKFIQKKTHRKIRYSRNRIFNVERLQKLYINI